MDIAFDSNASPVPDSVEPDTDSHVGVFRLGDFNWFTSFLTTMEPMSEEKHE